MTKRRWRVHIFFRDDISTYGHLDARLPLRKRRVILGRPYRVRMRPSYEDARQRPVSQRYEDSNETHLSPNYLGNGLPILLIIWYTLRREKEGTKQSDPVVNDYGQSQSSSSSSSSSLSPNFLFRSRSAAASAAVRSPPPPPPPLEEALSSAGGDVGRAGVAFGSVFRNMCTPALCIDAS
ncbi:hypothetical protein POSPLADRAFT_1106659, partial [Postia placenta MAD-698-R-SB12]